MPNPYSPATFKLADAHYRIHGNSEQTHVVVLQTDDRDWVGVAYDVDPKGYEPVAADCIAYGPTKQDAAERARRWMTEHPKGVLQDLGDDSGGGKITGLIKRMFTKLNDYGNDLIEQQQQEGKQ